MYSLLMFVFLSQSIYCRAEWRDPYDMNSGVDELKKVVLVQTNENTHAHIDNRHVLLHYKRLIHLLLNSISFDRSNENIYAGRIEFNLHKDDFDFLKAFTDNSDDTVGTFNKIDEIISRQFKKSKLNEYIEMYLTWTDHIYLHCFNKGTALLVIAAFAMYFVLRLLREKYPLWYVFKLIIFILWIFDSLLTYMQLSSEEEANTMADTAKFASLPMSCKQQNMNWWQVAWNSMVGKDDCREYYKAMLRKEIYLVTPLMVLSHQVGVVVATPAYKIGTALGNFCSGIMGALPFGIGIILLPGLCIFVAIIVCILLSFVTNTSFSINFFHLLKLRLGNQGRQSIGDALSGNNLTSLMNLKKRRVKKGVKSAHKQ